MSGEQRNYQSENPMGNIPRWLFCNATDSFGCRVVIASVIFTLAKAIATLQCIIVVLRDWRGNSKGDADGGEDELGKMHRWLQKMFLVACYGGKDVTNLNCYVSVLYTRELMLQTWDFIGNWGEMSKLTCCCSGNDCKSGRFGRA